MIDFPEDYPKRLRKISWCLEGDDCVICGPNKTWNKHLPYETRGDSLFVKQVLLDWFDKNGCPRIVCEEEVEYFCKAFTVYFTEEKGEFTISMKKDKDTKKPIFNEEKWHSICKYSSKTDSRKLLKMMLEAVKKTYDGVLGI